MKTTQFIGGKETDITYQNQFLDHPYLIQKNWHFYSVSDTISFGFFYAATTNIDYFCGNDTVAIWKIKLKPTIQRIPIPEIDPYEIKGLPFVDSNGKASFLPTKFKQFASVIDSL